MKIRMLRDVGGTFHNHDNGVIAGDEVDVDEESGVRYCELGYAEPVTKTAEKAVAREERNLEKAEEELADKVVNTTKGAPIEDPPHQVSTAALDPDAVIHDVTPEEPPESKRGPVEKQPVLKADKRRETGVGTVPSPKRTSEQ